MSVGNTHCWVSFEHVISMLLISNTSVSFQFSRIRDSLSLLCSGTRNLSSSLTGNMNVALLTSSTLNVVFKHSVKHEAKESDILLFPHSSAWKQVPFCSEEKSNSQSIVENNESASILKSFFVPASLNLTLTSSCGHCSIIRLHWEQVWSNNMSESSSSSRVTSWPQNKFTWEVGREGLLPPK